jgi:hypothetical protein
VVRHFYALVGSEAAAAPFARHASSIAGSFGCPAAAATSLRRVGPEAPQGEPPSDGPPVPTDLEDVAVQARERPPGSTSRVKSHDGAGRSGIARSRGRMAKSRSKDGVTLHETKRSAKVEERGLVLLELSR